MFRRKKKKVTIDETFFAVLIVLVLMLGTLLFAATSKTARLQDKITDLQTRLDTAETMLEAYEE